MTWLELCALFIARGGTHTTRPHDLQNLAQPRTYLATILKQFKTTTKLVIDDCADNITRAFFKPAKHTQPRLLPLGYTNHQPAFNAITFCTPTEQQDIYTYLISLGTRLNPSRIKQLHDGTLQTNISRLAIRGAPNFTEYITTRPAITSYIDAHVKTQPAQQSPQPNPRRLTRTKHEYIQLVCTFCNTKRIARTTSLCTKQGWGRLHCKNCHRKH